MSKMMSGLVATLLLLAAGCGGGPVSDEEFSTYIGRPIEDAVKRLGPPDRDHDGWASWEGKVTGPGGRVWERAQLKYDHKTRKVITTAISSRE